MHDRPTTVLFDLGGVLIRWNPRNLYRKLFAGDVVAMESFLSTVCTPSWNLYQDMGRPLTEGTRLLQDQFPQHADLIAAFYDRWEEMLAGDIPENVRLLQEVVDSGVQTLAITDWSAETFPLARRRFGFLNLFEGIVVSGEVGALKPSEAIFSAVEQRHGSVRDTTVFIDDSQENVDGARALGYDAVLYVDPEQLRSALAQRGVVNAAPRPTLSAGAPR